MKYSANMIYNKYDFIAIAKATLYQSEDVRKKQTISQLIFSILGVVSIFFGTLSILKGFRFILFGGGTRAIMEIVVPVIFITIGFIMILGSDSSKIGTNMWKQYPEKGSEIRFSFYTDYLEISTPNGKKRLKYSDIKSISEDWKRYFLFTDINVGYIVSKSALKLEDPKDFGKFLVEQTGLKKRN